MASGDGPGKPLLQNPMLDDYESDFNTYDSGPGRDLPLSRQRPRRPNIGAGDMAMCNAKTDDLIQLYVTGIPNEMTDEGLSNLFSQAGKVLYAHKCRAVNPNFDTSYGFVKFMMKDEASVAIAKLNNYIIQGKYQLRVSIALTAEQKAERKKKQTELENILSYTNPSDSNCETLPPGRVNGTPENSHVTTLTNGTTLKRGLIQRTTPSPCNLPNWSSPHINPSPGTGRGCSLYKPSGQGAARDRVTSTPDSASACGSDDGSVQGEGRRRRVHKPKSICVVCKVKKGMFHCSQCKETAYCGRECQKIDWPKHQLICGKRSCQEKEFEKHFEVEVDCTPQEVHEHLLEQKLASHGACKVEDLAKETLPYNAFTLVVVTDVVGPNNFCVVKEGMTVELQNLKDDMNLFYEGTVNVGPGSYVPVVNEVCAAHFKDDGEWYRVHVQRISLNATLDVTYVDFGNHETINVTDIRRIQPRMLRLPLQAIRCALGVVPPTNAQEIENFNKLSSIMLNTDKKYMCQPLEVTVNASIVPVQLQTLGASKDIADFFVRQSMGVRTSQSHLVPCTVVPTPSRPADLPTSLPKAGQFLPGSSAANKDVSVPAVPSPESTSCLLKNAAHNLPPVDEKTALRVRVLEVVSPSHFLVHFLDGVNELDKLPALHRRMTEHYGTMPPNTVFKIQPNSLYAVKFARDGLWYRALPYDSRGFCVYVQYVDYGTRESVHFSQIHPLEQRFCVLPQQAVCCTLANIHPKLGSWTEEAAIAFRDELLVSGSMAMICAYKKVQSVLVVELCLELTPGDSTINKLLLSRGLAVPSAPEGSTITGGDSAAMTPTMKKVGGKAVKVSPPVGQQTTEPRSVKTSPKYVSSASPKSELDSVKCKLPPTVAILKTLKPHADSNHLIVTSSSGPHDITVQFIEPDLVATVQSLTEALANTHATYSGTYTPVNGELICAKFSVDNTWYRAEVIQVKGNGARVRFVDYGNVDDVDATCMSALPSDLLTYPVMGVKCQLAGVGPIAPGCWWDENQLRPFQLWRFKLSGKDAPFGIELFDNDTGASLNSALASNPSVVPTDTTKTVMQLRNVKIPERDQIHIQVTDANDASHVNVQILDDDYILDLARLTEELSLIEPADVRGKPGDVVCAKYSLDDKWYRAVVLESTHGDVKVRFIDYGNMETLLPERIAPITDSLMDFPIMVVPCSLSGVDAIVMQDEWTSMVTLFEPMSMTVTGHGDGGHVIIELFDMSDQCLNKKLITSGICTTSVATSTAVMASSLVNIVLPSTDKLLKVQVVNASHGPEHITVQILEGEFLANLQDLTLTLAEKYADHPGGYQPSTTGELVCAKFSADNTWYRAEVIKLGDKILLRFIDFGNTDEVDVASIAKIDTVLLLHPVLGLHCRLAGVGSPAQGSMWDETFLKPFQPLDMRVVDAGASVVSVEMLDAGHSLNEQLMKAGMLLSPAHETASQKFVSPVNTSMAKETRTPTVDVKPTPKLAISNLKCGMLSPAISTPDTKTKTTPAALPQPVTIDSLKRIRLPAVDKICVQVTDASRPGNITVQLLENEYLTDLAGLTQILVDTHREYTGEYMPQVGEVVCAKFSGEWSRADVLALLPGRVASVRFFDFGNVEEISYADIAKITDEAILRFPILGLPCRLGEAGPMWKSDSLVLFDTVLLTVVDRVCESEPLVELFNAQSGSSLTEELVKRDALLGAVQKVVMVSKDDLDKVELPVDVGHVKVRVTDAYSPSSITVQVLQGDSLAGLTTLSDALVNSFVNYAASYTPQKGELVCAKFSQDNCWYRAEVLVVLPSGNARVKFVDYGNSEEVSPESLAKIPPSLCKYPVFGVTCRLAGVGGVASGRVWDPALVRPFDLLTLTVESSNMDGYTVKLYDDAKCLNVNLVNSGMLIGYPAPQGLPVAPSPATPKDCIQNGMPMASLSSNQMSMPLKVSPVNCTVLTTPVVQPPPYMKCLPMQDLSRDHPLVMPCYLEGPDEFYVQSLDPDCVNRLTELTEALTNCYTSNKTPVYEPKLKELVAAYCVADNAWYRAVIIEFYGSTHYKVVFVDYGNVDLVAVSTVHQLEPMFAKLPRQAVRVSLFGMTPTDVRWSGVAISVFSEEILNKACTMTVARKDGDVFIIADIAVSGMSVIDKMVSDGYLKSSEKAANGPSANATSPRPAATVNNVNVSEVVKISEIAVQQLPDTDDVTVSLGHVVSPSDFFVHLTGNKASVEMHMKLNEHCKKTTEAYMQFVHAEVVCALYNNVWYRSVVIETPSSGGLAKLCFFDFGNTEHISPKNIRRMPRCFASVSQQGIPCCLGGIAPAEQWSSEAVDWFTKLLNVCFKVKQLGHKDGRHQIDLRYDDEMGKSVSQEMISVQLATSVVAPGSEPTLAQRANLTPVTLTGVAAPPHGVKMYRLGDLPKLQVIDEMDVVIVEVNNLELFFCHQAKKESMEALASLIQQMDEHCNQLPVIATFNPQPGDMCCALFQGDWYRAVVEKRQMNKASVFLVDFGNLLTDSVSNLRPFSNKFCLLPPQAMKCSFAGLIPVGPEWTPESTDAFKSLVAIGDRPVSLYMFVVEHDSDCLRVRLVDTTGDDVNGKDLGAQLVAMGMAAYKDVQVSESVAAQSVQDMDAKSLAEENAKLKRELDELRRMMQQQKL